MACIPFTVANTTLTYKLTEKAGLWVIALAEWLIKRVSPDEVFYNTAHFKWVAQVEAMCRPIQAELVQVMKGYETIPELKHLSPQQGRIIEGRAWKSYFFYAYGVPVQRNCNSCPQTVKALQHIPGMVTAFYSILEAGTHLTPHRGPYKGVLRYHLALQVPQPNTACALKVDEEVRHWQFGESLIFDDSHQHEAWNHSNEKRVVLFVDFERPLPFPVSTVNRAIIWLMGRSPFIRQITDKA